MGVETGIQWCHHTFNPWRGCTKVSPGCAHCYAEKLSHRNPAVLGEWGPGGNRVVGVESYWQQPERWAKDAVRAGARRRVFCASLADVFDAEAPVSARRRLWRTISSTSGYYRGCREKGGLDWLLLTKRPERIGDVLREDKLRPAFFQDNFCWVGTSVESQEYTRRIWAVEHWGFKAFVSAEPLLGPLELPNALEVLDWLIVGGESGADARPMHPDWARSLRDQCQAANVPFFFKQWGGTNKKAAGNVLDGRTWEEFPA